MKNFNDTIGNRSSDLPACSAVPRVKGNNNNNNNNNSNKCVYNIDDDDDDDMRTELASTKGGEGLSSCSPPPPQNFKKHKFFVPSDIKRFTRLTLQPKSAN
jgi:hypothetical protein